MSDRRLEVFARRMRTDSYFLASAMEDYARSEGLDGLGLARVLGCATDELGAIGLCRRPHSDPERFAADVAQIAERFGLVEEQLAELVRRSDALLALREAESEAMVAAARDRPTDGNSPDGTSE